MAGVQGSSEGRQAHGVRRLLPPPVSEDPAKTGAERLNHWLALALIAANLLALVALIAVLPEHTTRFVTLIAVILAVGLTAFFLNRSGRPLASAWALVASLWLVGCGSAWTAGGTTNTAIACLIVLAAMGAVLLGPKAGIALAAAGVVTVWVIAYAETSGLLPEPSLVQTAWVRAIWLSDFIALTAFAMVLFAQDLVGARDRALEGLDEIARNQKAARAVMDNAPFGAHMYLLDDEDRLLFTGYNRKAEEMLGMDHTGLLGKTLEEAFPGNVGTETPEAYRRVAREGGVYDLDQYAYDAEDLAGVFEVHAFNFGPGRVSVFFRDVTEKRRAELALLEADEMLAVAQRAAGAGFWSWDVPSGKLTWTPEFFHLFGLPPDAPAIFDTWRAALHPDDVEAAEARIMQAMENHTPLDNEYRIVLPDGHIRWIGALGTTTYDEDGSPLRMAGICIDSSEKRRREEEIRALNAELEQRVEERTRELSIANRELQDFVYSASHDLRAPLRALDGFSEVLLEDCAPLLPETDLGHLRRIRSASQHMAELIDALLALSRVGRREVALERVDLSAATWAIVDALREADPDRRVSVAIEEGLEARTDPALADIVLTNLLGNAWKFTARGDEARIEVGAVRDNGGGVFYVRDDGAGFDQEHAADIFRPFHRQHTQEEFQGTGIGLATVQRALDKLGGNCRAEGEAGKGATFFFTLG
jgi:signal transduction histidine kinase